MADQPPFDLIDNDGPSHLWVLGTMLKRKYGMEVVGDYLHQYAVEMNKLRGERERCATQLEALADSSESQRAWALYREAAAAIRKGEA
jgi:hypothetical protein